MVIFNSHTSISHPEDLRWSCWADILRRQHAEVLECVDALQAPPLQGHPSFAALHAVPLLGMLCAEGAVLSPVAMQLLPGELS